MTLKKNITNLADNSPWSFNTNITPANQSILDKVLALNPVSYNWNTETDSDPKHAGFIAQEVQQVFPDLVSTNPTTHLLSLDYTGLVPYTVAALQQMNLEIQALQAFPNPNLGQNISDAITSVKNLVTDTLTVGTSDKPTGITLYDTATGNAYCLSIANGQNETTPGVCPTASSGSTNQTANTGDATDTGGDSDNIQSPEVTDPVITAPDSGSTDATQSPAVTDPIVTSPTDAQD